jgi:hypothetical protein
LQDREVKKRLIASGDNPAPDKPGIYEPLQINKPSRKIYNGDREGKDIKQQDG